MTFTAEQMRVLAAGDRVVAAGFRSPRNAEFCRRWRERKGPALLREYQRAAFRRYVEAMSDEERADLRKRRQAAVRRYQAKMRSDPEYRRKNAERCRRWHAAKKARSA